MKQELRIDFEKVRKELEQEAIRSRLTKQRLWIELPATTIRSKLLLLLKTSPWITMNDICLELEIMWPGGLYRVISSLVKQEQIIWKPQIQASGHFAKVYALKTGR